MLELGPNRCDCTANAAARRWAEIDGLVGVGGEPARAFVEGARAAGMRERAVTHFETARTPPTWRADASGMETSCS